MVAPNSYSTNELEFTYEAPSQKVPEHASRVSLKHSGNLVIEALELSDHVRWKA